MFKYSIIMFHFKACQEKAERKAILNFAFGLLTLLWTWRPPYDKRIFACPIASFTTRSSEFQTENAQIRNSHHFSTHQLRFFQIQGLLCYYSVAFSRTCKLLFSCADTWCDEKSWLILLLKIENSDSYFQVKQYFTLFVVCVQSHQVSDLSKIWSDALRDS